MTTSITPYCADVSREAGESQFGTAPEKQIWLLLQYDAAWEPKAIKNNNLPPDVKAYLDSILETVPNARMLFIRQTPHPTHEKLAFFVVRTGDQPTAYHFTLNAYDNLLELDIPAIASGAPEYDAHRHTDPLFLVCTHGKRDKCCAHYGLPVYNALKQIEGHTVWQSSHVSGHRFAANVICFPHGVYYGRVFPDDLAKLAAAYRAGHVNPAFYRGRAGDAAHVQAAEYFIRRETGLTEIAALHLDHAQPTAEGDWLVQFTARDGTQHSVTLAEAPSDFGILKSCTDDEVCAVPQYQLATHDTHPA